MGRRDPLLRLIMLARPWRGRLLLAAAGAAAAGCGVALLAVSGFLLARASQQPSILAISTAVVAVRALSAGRGVSRYLERLASHDAAFRILADVRVSIYRRLERLAPAGLTACLVILTPAGSLLAAGLLAAGIGIPVLAAAAARDAARRLAPARGQLAATFTDLLAGAAELHAYGAQDTALTPVTAADRDLTRQADRNSAVSGLSAGLSSAIAGLTVWGVLLLGVAATGDGALTRVPLAVLTLTALASFEVVTALPAAAVQLGQARVSGRRIAAVLDAPDPVRECPAPRPLPDGPVRVRLHGAQVRYEPGGRPALDGIDLDLPPGRRVALVGPNGAGKSTVASVLLRFVELTAGTATLNGHDLASYSADDLRTRIGGCPQDPHIFDASLRDNLRLARPEATDEQLAGAAARAGLLDWIGSLPLGWDTPAGARGAALSGGQRQRLALARALLADPALLVLDEPAAHLDSDARRALTRDILAATAGHATLLITHDRDGLDQLDEIVVLRDGRVIERGSHAELMRANGSYQRMWRRGH
jgi:ATP-binding cassette, subfamily C, bacterial CydC